MTDDLKGSALPAEREEKPLTIDSDGKERVDAAVSALPVREEAARPLDLEHEALIQLFEAYQGLKRLGWSDIMYCPKDGTWFDAIEVGSTGIHQCRYDGQWPDGHWWVSDGHDIYPSRPVLFRKSALLVVPGRDTEKKEDQDLSRSDSTG